MPNCSRGVQAILIFPHQLFEHHPGLPLSKQVWMVEEHLFFSQYPFHQAKLVLHRASMKAYAHRLEKQGFDVHYVEASNGRHRIQTVITDMAQHGINSMVVAELVDNWLEKRLIEAAMAANINITWTASPYFLLSNDEVKGLQPNGKKWHQTTFYQAQRKSRKILVGKDGTPIGGKWTFDAENRKRIPSSLSIPQVQFPAANSFVIEAIDYVLKHFGHNPGNAATFHSERNNFFPIDTADTKIWFESFLQTRFKSFGDYEDAMIASEPFLFHSVLTPMLNVGLITPKTILEKALTFGEENNIPINTIEGFVRQIMGWREFIRVIYQHAGIQQRTTNFWGFQRKIPPSWYDGSTGIIPIDQTIKKLLQVGYNHHIERLMILGNFMLLCEFSPDEVYRWFMEMYVDSYDWVMVPNVYGMTQFADGGLMTTKPYISGSNYLMKMGDWPKGEWQAVWDGLFWRFMNKHRAFLSKNPRLSMLLKTFDSFSVDKKKKLIDQAESFLQQLDQEYHEKTPTSMERF
jgi:deoxyribodipyrimidine photolyase-related protein